MAGAGVVGGAGSLVSAGVSGRGPSGVDEHASKTL
jgi:hypothetical protein